MAPRLTQPGWTDLAHRCFGTVCRLTARVHHNPRPLTTIKDATYAWRHMVFFLSLCSPEDQRPFIADLDTEAARRPAHVRTRLAPAIWGLATVADGGAFTDDGTIDGDRGRRFLGWSAHGHWMR